MTARWYFDFISPYAYLQLGRMLALREHVEIAPVPIVFGAVLQHFGQLGPAEIPGKREFTYRFVQWQAETQGIPLRFPPAHPFNTLSALRLCVAAGATWESVGAIFEHIWRDGLAADTPAALSDLARRLGIEDLTAIGTDSVKAQLRANTEAAIATGVYGVPYTLLDDGARFWGNDASDMIAAHLADPARFSQGEYARLDTLPVGVQRAR